MKLEDQDNAGDSVTRFQPNIGENWPLRVSKERSLSITATFTYFISLTSFLFLVGDISYFFLLLLLCWVGVHCTFTNVLKIYPVYHT
jgi:hypothetical protein